MNIYAHLKDFNIAILENTWPEARWISATILKMILLKVIFERCCTKVCLYCLLTMARWLPLCRALSDIFLNNLSAGCLGNSLKENTPCSASILRNLVNFPSGAFYSTPTPSRDESKRWVQLAEMSPRKKKNVLKGKFEGRETTKFS